MLVRLISSLYPSWCFDFNFKIDFNGILDFNLILVDFLFHGIPINSLIDY